MGLILSFFAMLIMFLLFASVRPRTTTRAGNSGTSIMALWLVLAGLLVLVVLLAGGG